mmetsp:Transcript_10911/g.32710  ORF Transcript_10911/g.32710 Transcript_10911/m.32710 type:complete len:80 (+) Transcript_10911:752-991(+)
MANFDIHCREVRSSSRLTAERGRFLGDEVCYTVLANVDEAAFALISARDCAMFIGSVDRLLKLSHLYVCDRVDFRDQML